MKRLFFCNDDGSYSDGGARRAAHRPLDEGAGVGVVQRPAVEPGEAKIVLDFF